MNQEKSRGADLIRMMNVLFDAWRQHPELRLGQLLVNLVGVSQPCPEIFYITDKDLLEKLRKYADGDRIKG